MVKEVISSILNAETQAEEIVKTAQIDARKMIEDANETAQKIKLEANGKMKEERKLELKRAADEAETKYNADIASAKVDADNLIADGKKRVSKAVEFIEGRVVS
ncbi:MAG: hypothetical protein RR458_03250 [Clostridia bacterium]